MLRYIFIAVCFFHSFAVVAQEVGFDDHRPVYWDGTPPTAYPVHGVDVARYQGTPNWEALRNDGVSFAFIKATEGSDFLDSSFTYNWNATAQAGIARGAYHFYYFCSTPEAQAAWFIRNVPRQAGSLPPVIDVELNPDSSTCRHNPGPAEALDVISRFINILEAHYGQRPIVYTANPQYYDFQLYNLPNVEFWLRSTARVPSSVFGSQNWTFWQYTATARIPGVNGNIDANAFSGSPAQWRSWTSRRMIK